MLAIVPTVALPPAIPLTLHATRPAAPPSPATLAAKTCSSPVGTFAVGGETVTVKLSPRLTVAESLADESAWLTAVTVTLGDDGSTVGAVYVAVPVPVAAIVPTLEFPPAIKFTSHDTLVFEVPATIAWNCCVAPSNTLALLGAIVTVTLGAGLVGGLPAIPHAVPLIAQTHSITTPSFRAAVRPVGLARFCEISIDHGARARTVPMRSSYYIRQLAYRHPLWRDMHKWANSHCISS